MGATPEELVRTAQDAYNAFDLERVLALFTPEVVFHENGRLVGKSIEDVRLWHERFFAAVRDFRISKTLRVADGAVIGVEYATSFTSARTGRAMESFGGEFWTMDADRLAEWRLHWSAYQAQPGGASARPTRA